MRHFVVQDCTEARFLKKIFTICNVNIKKSSTLLAQKHSLLTGLLIFRTNSNCQMNIQFDKDLHFLVLLQQFSLGQDFFSSLAPSSYNYCKLTVSQKSQSFRDKAITFYLVHTTSFKSFFQHCNYRQKSLPPHTLKYPIMGQIYMLSI